MEKYFSGLRFGFHVGRLASFGMPLLAVDTFVHEVMENRGAGLTNALSMAYKASRGVFGSSRESYRWYMGNVISQNGYDKSFFRYGANVGLLAPSFGLFGIYRGAKLYRDARNHFSRAAGVAMMALSVGGLYYGARLGLDFTGMLLNSYTLHRAGIADDANIPRYSLAG